MTHRCRFFEIAAMENLTSSPPSRTGIPGLVVLTPPPLP